MFEGKNFNQFGEVIPQPDEIKQEKDPESELVYRYDSLVGVESVLPRSVQKPAGVMYWAPERLTFTKMKFEEVKALAEKSGLIEVTRPDTGEKIILKDFFDMIQMSIEYSERVNKEREKIIEEIKEELDSPEKIAARKKLFEKLSRDTE